MSLQLTYDMWNSTSNNQKNLYDAYFQEKKRGTLKFYANNNGDAKKKNYMFHTRTFASNKYLLYEYRI